MKITAVKTYITPTELSKTPWGRGQCWVLVRLETDTGITGWGQAYTFRDREKEIATEVHKLSPLVDAMDPFCIKQFVSNAHKSIREPQTGIEISSAAAGIEIALWDIVGKALGVPIYKLLGGPCRDRIGVYANCWSDEIRTPDQLASFAAEQAKKGFKAVKLYPFLYGNTVEDGVAFISAVRDAVGPDVAIYIDMWDKMRPEDQPQIIEALKTYGVPWFEDPADANDVDALARIRRQSNLPVVSGETLYSKQQFLRLLEKKAVDILNPDITLCGILGMTEIASMAEAFTTTVSVHNNNTMTIGLSAAMQAAAVIPNVTLIEHFPRFVNGSNAFSHFPAELGDDGCIPLPREPGLGVTVNEEMVAAMEYHPGLDD